jgi:hypothetical protein
MHKTLIHRSAWNGYSRKFATRKRRLSNIKDMATWHRDIRGTASILSMLYKQGRRSLALLFLTPLRRKGSGAC